MLDTLSTLGHWAFKDECGSPWGEPVAVRVLKSAYPPEERCPLCRQVAFEVGVQDARCSSFLGSDEDCHLALLSGQEPTSREVARGHSVLPQLGGGLGTSRGRRMFGEQMFPAV